MQKCKGGYFDEAGAGGEVGGEVVDGGHLGGGDSERVGRHVRRAGGLGRNRRGEWSDARVGETK